MIDLLGYKGFSLQKGDKSLEAQRLHFFCVVNDIEIKRFDFHDDFDFDYVPSGSVEWCSKLLGYSPKPDYYPEWCKDYLNRGVWLIGKFPYEKRCFIKPASRYKRFTGFVKPAYSWKNKKKKEQYWCSEITSFINEWRYYITKGKVLTGEWYYGDDINTPDAPELTIEIPENYSGALDFGWDTRNNFSLIESQHPFACGWYGPQDKDHLYFQWLINGWNELNNT